MTGCRLHCGPCKPKWMRLVDNIYPRNPRDGIDRDNMSKLTFFSLRNPSKLDRIADRLTIRLSHDLNRRRYDYVNMTMDAIDSLLKACHAQNLNLFVESFLRMVQKLLETNDPHLQILGTQSFVKFSQIEEDTPSYHRTYDFLLARFTEMCHSNITDPATMNNLDVTTNRIRIAGMQGLQGIIRKTVNDDLQVNIWEESIMNKIIPSLLFNMTPSSGIDNSTTSASGQLPGTGGTRASMGGGASEPLTGVSSATSPPGADASSNADDPVYVAEAVFRDLMCRATYANINSVMKPMLQHFDNHSLWVPSHFILHCFKLLMFSISVAQFSHRVVELLVEHISSNESSSPAVRTSMMEVLSQTVILAASEAIGPAVFSVFKTLFQVLHSSIEIASRQPADSQEKAFQEALITTVGEFANNLPDTQKMEIMKYILAYESTNSDSAGRWIKSKALTEVLLKTMLRVATKYETVRIANAFTSEFMELLLKRLAVDADPGIRLIVQKILHTLLDRHGNVEELQHVRTYRQNTLHKYFKWEKPDRQDIIFVKKSVSLLTANLYRQMLDPSNKVDNLEHMYTTMSLMALEVGDEDVLVELFRLALAAQRFVSAGPGSAAVPPGLDSSPVSLPLTHRCAIHALLAAFISILTQLETIAEVAERSGFAAHVQTVLSTRETEAPYLLPKVAFNRSNTSDSYPAEFTLHDQLLFSEEVVQSMLEMADLDHSNLTEPYELSSGPGPSFNLSEDMTRSTSDLMQSVSNFSVTDSVASTPSPERKGLPDDITFDVMNKIMREPAEMRRQRKMEEDKKLMMYYRTADFDDICQKQRETVMPDRLRLNEVLDTLARSVEHSDMGETCFAQNQPSVWEINFPSYFVS